MPDDVDPVERGIEVGGDQVGLDEPESVVRERARQVPSLRRRVVVVGEAVDADDLVAFREQAVDERASDEPGCTGDDDGHGESL